MYADYEYYTTEYGGKVDEPTHRQLAKKADRIIDRNTFNRLKYAFPEDEETVEAVKDCECELIDFIYAVNAVSGDAVGLISTSEGFHGKVIKSVSSGSESVTYDNGSDSSYGIASKDKNVFDMMAYQIIRNCLSGLTDNNGIMLLYAGV